MSRRHLPLEQIVIYHQQAYFISGLKLNPSFYIIHRLFGRGQHTVHISELWSSNLTTSDMYVLNISNDDEFLNTFPELFI